jgi:hypothetical protein
MNQQGLTYAKFGIVGFFVIGVFLLAALGKIDATAAIAASTAGVSALVIALGISAGASASAAGAVKAAATPTPPAAVAVPDVAKADQRGFAPVRLLGMLAGCAAMIAIASLLTGCLSSAPIVPVTPQNQAQVSSCQNTATLHDDFVIGDFVLGGVASGLASASAAVSDQQTKTNFAIATAGVGGVLVIGTAVAAYTASNFVASQCANVVGPLPTQKNPNEQH